MRLWLFLLVGVPPSGGLSLPASAAEWYVSPKGTEKNKGTRASPWDIASALGGRSEVRPGDTVYLLGGTYRRRPREQYELRLAGTQEKPIHVRPVPGERVTIDGGLVLMHPSAHLWVWDLEITVSEPQPAKPTGPAPDFKGLNRPWGGLNSQNDPVQGGHHCKFIHLVIHHCLQGVSFWRTARDCEIYGCLIYDNGWPATDRGHGHAIYTQNETGIKTIADNIMTGGHGYTLHAYGSKKAYVNNFHVEGNIAYAAGAFLVGGGRPSTGIRVLNNYLHGVQLRLGYSAPYNEDCEVRGNVVVNAPLEINRFRKVVKKDNLVLGEKDRRPAGARVVVRPSKYDPHRAHLAIFNWQKTPVVPIDTGTFLKPGERFRLLDPRDFFGKPVLEGKYDGKPIRVPLKGEFAALVLQKVQAMP
jgi:hypothetical protein